MAEELFGRSAVTRRQALVGGAVAGGVPLITGAVRAGSPEWEALRPDPSPDLRRMLAEVSPRRVEHIIRTLVSFGTRNTLSSQDDPVRGIGAARDWLFAEYQKIAATSGGRMTVELQSYVQEPIPRVPVPTRVTNVVATLHGSRPESAGRVYVASGHYDSMPTSVVDAVSDAPGANDDASGVAAVMEAARVMATRRFDATVVFMAVAGEEQGLLGSNFAATQARAQGVDVAGMFTNDIVGSSVGQDGTRDPFTVRMFAEGLPRTPLLPQETEIRAFGGETELTTRQLARFVKDAAENSATRMRVRLIYRRDRFGRGGDHIPFLTQGYPAVRFTEAKEDYRHQHQDVRVQDGVQFGDLPEFVDFDYIARVARVNAIGLASLALAPAAPSTVQMARGGLNPDTLVRWAANTESDLAGYEVMIRPTTEPEWTEAVGVGNVTTITLRNVPKDDFFFGVRAVDTSGHRSPVSFARPAAIS